MLAAPSLLVAFAGRARPVRLRRPTIAAGMAGWCAKSIPPARRRPRGCRGYPFEVELLLDWLTASVDRSIDSIVRCAAVVLTILAPESRIGHPGRTVGIGLDDPDRHFDTPSRRHPGSPVPPVSGSTSEAGSSGLLWTRRSGGRSFVDSVVGTKRRPADRTRSGMKGWDGHSAAAHPQPSIRSSLLSFSAVEFSRLSSVVVPPGLGGPRARGAVCFFHAAATECDWLRSIHGPCARLMR